jgi:hypothetical protein
MTIDQIRPVLHAVFPQLSRSGPVTLHPLNNRGNNRVYRVDVEGTSVLAKIYFHHPEDRRDRLGAEFRFSTYAWNQGIRCIPEPLGCDPGLRLGLYAYIEGRRLDPPELSKGMLSRALGFVEALNRTRQAEAAKALLDVSEACFSMRAHLACVTRRVSRLKALAPQSLVDEEALRFIRSEVWEAWQEVMAAVVERVQRDLIPMDEEVVPADRMISPSDFGFHNALWTPDERLIFHDFEYAGWDDPARLVCDFFCQPAVPVPHAYFDWFADSICGATGAPERCKRRCHLLFPVYQIKWCCIMLNDFLAVGEERRRFARHGQEHEDRKAVQLDKARRALDRITLPAL